MWAVLNFRVAELRATFGVGAVKGVWAKRGLGVGGRRVRGLGVGRAASEYRGGCPEMSHIIQCKPFKL